jgi:hypothetical protein
MKRVVIAAVGLALVVVLSACGSGEQQSTPTSVEGQATATVGVQPTVGAAEAAEANSYVAQICEPFAKYVGLYVQLQGQAASQPNSFDDLFHLLQMMQPMKANLEVILAEFRSIEPPATIRDEHEQILADLQTEIDQYGQIETALQNYKETGDKGVILAVGSQALALAGVKPADLGLFANGPQAYLEAWQRDCVPRLNEITGD